MKKISLTIFLIFLFSVDNLALTKAATTDLGKILKIQTAVKGKKLNKFFSDNILLLSFEKKKKEYRFQQKKYEVFEDGKLIESGKWKVSGLLKNQIKLIPESKSKPYYLKKINKKPIIYHYNKSPGTENAIKTLVEIESSSKFTEVSSSTESTETNTASSSITSSESIDKDTKATKKEKKGKKFKYEELKPKHKKKLAKLEDEWKSSIRFLKGDENEVQFLHSGSDFGSVVEYAAAKYCAQFKKFAFAFWDTIETGDLSGQKRAEFYVCSKEPVLLNPKTGSKILWSNYDDASLYKYPDKHLYLYRYYYPPFRVSKYMKKYVKKVKAEDPNFFKDKKDKVLTVYHKDENEIHIKVKLLDLTLKKPEMIAIEHCSKYDKYAYHSADDLSKGKNGSAVFHCSKKTLYASPLSSGEINMSNDPNSPFNQVAQGNTYSSSTSQNMNANASQFKIYNASSKTTFYFFEASHNFMSSLELLYRAYDQNTEADKLKAQIEYNRESKFTESQKLKSTKSIIDKSSVQINAKLTDTSLILSDLGRGYYEQSLPYAFSATENAYNLFITVKNTKERVSASGDLFTGLLDNLSEVAGLATILPEIPTFSRNMIETSKLIFSGAKTKKIRDKGNLNKALEELNLSDM